MLPPALAVEAERALTDRLVGDGSGGMTLAPALAETDALLEPLAGGRVRDLLVEFRTWLLGRIERGAAFRKSRLPT